MTDSARLREKLLAGIAAMKLDLSDVVVEKLLAYLQLLAKWNRAYNLTAVRDIEQMVSRHLLDSLSILPFLESRDQRCADVGTGAGLPGLVLAICAPEKKFALFDSNGKKIRFVKQAIAELGLHNVEAFQTRIEEFPAQTYDVVTSRAFASLSEMAALCEHLLAADGRLLAMKGNYPDAELAALPSPWVLDAAPVLQIPEETGQRHLIVLRRA